MNKHPKLPLPASWPARIQCPDCKTWQDTESYHVKTRMSADLNPILVCQGNRANGRRCGHEFSPRESYFRGCERT